MSNIDLLIAAVEKNSKRPLVREGNILCYEKHGTKWQIVFHEDETNELQFMYPGRVVEFGVVGASGAVSSILFAFEEMISNPWYYLLDLDAYSHEENDNIFNEYLQYRLSIASKKELLEFAQELFVKSIIDTDTVRLILTRSYPAEELDRIVKNFSVAASLK